MRSLPVLVVAALVAVLAAGCGGSSSGKTASNTAPSAAASSPASSSAAATSSPQITIAGFAFGAPLTVKAGTKITVKNTDGVGHTVTSDDGKSFNLSVGGGATATLTAPSKPGTYKFHCAIHPQMHGSLTVTA